MVVFDSWRCREHLVKIQLRCHLLGTLQHCKVLPGKENCALQVKAQPLPKTDSGTKVAFICNQFIKNENNLTPYKKILREMECSLGGILGKPGTLGEEEAQFLSLCPHVYQMQGWKLKLYFSSLYTERCQEQKYNVFVLLTGTDFAEWKEF